MSVSSQINSNFQAYLRLKNSGNTPVLEGFLRNTPRAGRADLRRLISDYQILSKSTGRIPCNQPGMEVGDFRLMRELGAGGMGTVWEAEQASLKRRVALKILNPQFVSSPVQLKRFHVEGLSGGRLHHEGIVQVYGMGEDDGFHWIAQELIPDGLTLEDSLTIFRKEKSSNPCYYKKAAVLFSKIADALQVAHQNGVIHRDLKPSNILIAENDQPKVADFGLALLEGEKNLTQSCTAGTPFYMSPEQAAARRMGLDHRSDIFSFGVMLYETLTLTRPFDGDTSQQVFHKILTVEPLDPRKIHSKVPRDLAVICGMCMEKNPERRYASMEDVADDLRRYLGKEPILAKPPNWVVRCGKWINRHPALSAGSLAASVVILSLAWSYARVVQERDWRGQEVQTTERVVDFMSNLFSYGHPEIAQGKNTTVREALDIASRDLHRDASLNQEPEIKAAMMFSLGRAYRELGELTQAEDLVQETVEIRSAKLGEKDARTFKAKMFLAQIYQDQGKFDLAMPLFQQTWVGQKSILGITHKDTLATLAQLGLLHQDIGDLNQSRLMLTEAMEGWQGIAGADHPKTLQAANNLAGVLDLMGFAQQAELLFVDTLRRRRFTLGDKHPATLTSANNLGAFFQYAGRYKEAEELLVEVISKRKTVLGPEHPETLISMNNLGAVYWDQNELELAEPLYKKSLAGLRKSLGSAHPSTLSLMNNLGLLYQEQGKLSTAGPLFSEAYEGFAEVLPPGHPDTLYLLQNLVCLYLQNQKYDAALPKAEILLSQTEATDEKYSERLALLDRAIHSHQDY